MRQAWWDLNRRLNSDELRAFLQLQRPNIQVMNCPDGFEDGGEAALTDFLRDSFRAFDRTKPIFIPYVRNNHIVMLALMPTSNGMLRAYYADSLVGLQDGGHIDLGTRIVELLSGSFPHIVHNEIRDVSVLQQVGNNCGLAAIHNAIKLFDYFGNESNLDNFSLAINDVASNEEYFQRYGDSLLKKQRSNLVQVLSLINPMSHLRIMHMFDLSDFGANLGMTMFICVPCAIFAAPALPFVVVGGIVISTGRFAIDFAKTAIDIVLPVATIGLSYGCVITELATEVLKLPFRVKAYRDGEEQLSFLPVSATLAKYLVSEDNIYILNEQASQILGVNIAPININSNSTRLADSNPPSTNRSNAWMRS